MSKCCFDKIMNVFILDSATKKYLGIVQMGQARPPFSIFSLFSASAVVESVTVPNKC